MKKSIRRPYWLILAGIFIACWAVSRYLFQLALVQGASMEPAYRSGQLVLVDKTRGELRRGDVVLFYSAELDTTLIKRIAAVPGDRVVIMNGRLIVNGAAVPEYGSISYAGEAQSEITVPEGCYFLLGDNTEESKDSRYPYIGVVNEKDILGRVV